MFHWDSESRRYSNDVKIENNLLSRFCGNNLNGLFEFLSVFGIQLGLIIYSLLKTEIQKIKDKVAN